MPFSRPAAIAALCLASVCAPLTASAQVFGTFSWQMQPYCNVVTLTITQIPGGYTIDGHDDQCGAGKLAGAAGMALINPDGTVGLEFTIVTAPAGKALHVSASLSPATGSGPWTDSVGNSGTLALGANLAGLARPFPASGLGAGTVTGVELAPAAVGGTQIAANAITGAKVADGSLAMVDVANGPRTLAVNSPSFFSLTSTATVYLTLTLNAPSAGTVFAEATGYFAFTGASGTEIARCSLSPNGGQDLNYLTVASDFSSTTVQFSPMSTSRTFAVAAAGAVTVNLVCDLAGANGSQLTRPRMSALFVAQ